MCIIYMGFKTYSLNHIPFLILETSLSHILTWILLSYHWKYGSLNLLWIHTWNHSWMEKSSNIIYCWWYWSISVFLHKILLWNISWSKWINFLIIGTRIDLFYNSFPCHRTKENFCIYTNGSFDFLILYWCTTISWYCWTFRRISCRIINRNRLCLSRFIESNVRI
jgi:hypothetical protein